MKQVLTAMIKAHEIQGCIALENSFNRVGLDHVLLVKVASTAVVAEMLGLTREEILNAVSLAWGTVSRCAPIAMRRTPARVNPGRRAMPLPARYVWH